MVIDSNAMERAEEASGHFLLGLCGTQALLIIDHILMVTFNADGTNTEYQFAFSSIILSIGFLVFVALAYSIVRERKIHDNP